MRIFASYDGHNKCRVGVDTWQTYIVQIKRLSRVLNITALYSEYPGFKSRPGDRLFCLRFSWFYQSLQQILG
jgi:hypothetical protein